MKLNILVVDDETPICDWLVYCIRRASEDYVVTAASNGEEAYERIQEQKPDMVFTDIRMPGMDGLELMRRTLEILPYTVFAILTNYAEFSYAKQAVSLGAREYFLKSELRAADIEALLARVMASKTAKIHNKVNDVFPSGCIDLYEFYHTQEEPGFADRFWERHGMWKEVPYVLLRVPGGSWMEEWRKIADMAEELRRASGGTAYIAAASEKSSDYVIVQTWQNPESYVSSLVGRLKERGTIGISTMLTDRGEFATAIKEAACAQMAGFFDRQAEAIRYETLCRRPPLDRHAFQTRKQEILAFINQRRYSEAAALTDQWFGDIRVPQAADVKWAVESCQRMVLTIEEAYYHELAKQSQDLSVPTSVYECRERCARLLKGISLNYSRRCSPSITAALDYIHNHYGEDISMAEVARQIYRSPEYFSRQFKEEVGENFNAYLTLYRLDRAQELLDGTDMLITEIGERVGYSTPGYFSKIYKKYRGITPEQARMSKK